MDRRWRSYWRTAIGTALVLTVALHALVILVDPDDSLAVSLPFERVPVTGNQRYPYPALARKPYFDSAVVGTSTVRLLRPDKLNESLGGRFVNLSMDSATAYEQAELLAVFARSHPSARRILIGVDRVWCKVGDTLVKTTFRDFPEWLYDDNPWNDYVNLFNVRTLQDTYRTLRFAFGYRAGRFGPDGYANFLPPASEYDLAWAQRKIYGE
ncbi:MAG: hypothetical protein GY798_28145, partial [Hyphomicrobiales bacterium]|nr:hypothetical protein [Hyphomicrobiales bacterium]